MPPPLRPVNSSGQISLSGLRETGRAAESGARSYGTSGLVRGNTTLVTRGPFGLVVTDLSHPPIWGRITGAGQPLTTTLLSPIGTSDTTWTVATLALSVGSLLQPPFVAIIDSETVTVTAVAATTTDPATGVVSLVGPWTVIRSPTPASHAQGATITLPGTTPFAFVEVRQLEPGVWQDYVDGLYGTVEGEPTDASVLDDPTDESQSSSMDTTQEQTEEQTEESKGVSEAAIATQTSAPAYEVNGVVSVPTDGSAIVQLWPDPSGESYLFDWGTDTLADYQIAGDVSTAAIGQYLGYGPKWALNWRVSGQAVSPSSTTYHQWPYVSWAGTGAGQGAGSTWDYQPDANGGYPGSDGRATTHRLVEAWPNAAFLRSDFPTRAFDGLDILTADGFVVFATPGWMYAGSGFMTGTDGSNHPLYGQSVTILGGFVFTGGILTSGGANSNVSTGTGSLTVGGAAIFSSTVGITGLLTATGGMTLPSGATATVASGATLSVASGGSLTTAAGSTSSFATGTMAYDVGTFS